MITDERKWSNKELLERHVQDEKRIRELEAANAALAEQCRQLEQDREYNAGLCHELEARLAEAQRENTRLRAELERRKLKWRTGPIPQLGFYLFHKPAEGSFRGEWANPSYIIPTDREWAGPIEPPE